jgi:hypothetical protein
VTTSLSAAAETDPVSATATKPVNWFRVIATG